MKRKITQASIFVAVGLITAVVCDCNSLEAAHDVAPKRVPAKLTCGSHSSNPQQQKAFQIDLQFEVIGSLWVLDWKTEHSEVKFRGILSPSGTMLIAGLGRSEQGANWTYEFSGHKNPTGVAVLKGSLQSEQPKGTRSCSMTFQN